MGNLSTLKPSPGSTRNRKRLGRGPGSGHGKQAGAGGKGQKGSSGFKSKSWNEGGQMPLQRRLPKRGFRNIFHIDYQEVNVGVLGRIDVQDVTIDILRQHRLIGSKNKPVKILGSGELQKPLNIKAHAFSVSAREKIEKAGGKAELISSPAADRKPGDDLKR
jgi:large subunit ribosomal protein L15